MSKNSENIRYVLGIDPSGNFNEGKGTTGWCIFDKQQNKVIECSSIQAAKCTCQEGYWFAHINMIDTMIKQYREAGLAVSMEDYVLYSHQARAQINSTMETSQLIGIIKILCWYRCVPLHMRTASQVMKRWTDHILCLKGYIRKSNSSYFVDCKAKVTCDHERDAIRHAVHCATFELKENK